MDQFTSFYARHEKVAFLYSGGKDSAACLKLLRPWLEQTLVVWVNPGNPFPELIEHMGELRKQVPHFLEVKGNQPEWIKAYGQPVDCPPTFLGRPVEVRFIPAPLCCAHNLWLPLTQAIKERGITGVIKGQKLADSRQGSTQNPGIEWFHPLETWTDEDVFSFLGEDVPKHYTQGVSGSLDCMDCTAYLADTKGQREYLHKVAPEVGVRVDAILRAYRKELLAELESIDGR